MDDSQLPPFNVDGFREHLRNFVEIVKSDRSEFTDTQVQIQADLAARWMQILLKPIPLPYNTGSRSAPPSISPAQQAGVPVELARQVQRLVGESCYVYFSGSQAEALALAEQALLAWTSQFPPKP